MRTRLSNQIARYDGKNCFVEVLNNSFSIDKVMFNFVEYDEKTNKQTKKITLYIDIDKAMGLADRILAGTFKEETEAKKKTAGWNSYNSLFFDMGGISAEKVNKNFAKISEQYPFLKSGQALSRQLKIQAGMKLPWIFRAEANVGVEKDTGIVAPASGSAPMALNIPLTDDQLYALASMLKIHYNAYVGQFYNKYGNEMFDNKLNIYSSEH